jgi:hypothetical protein
MLSSVVAKWFVAFAHDHKVVRRFFPILKAGAKSGAHCVHIEFVSTVVHSAAKLVGGTTTTDIRRGTRRAEIVDGMPPCVQFMAESRMSSCLRWLWRNRANGHD